jgi:putative NADPH-quinone reductase
MRILVLDGHPDAGSYGDAVARAYVEGAESRGHDVRVLRLREHRCVHLCRGPLSALSRH